MAPTAEPTGDGRQDIGGHGQADAGQESQRIDEKR